MTSETRAEGSAVRVMDMGMLIRMVGDREVEQLWGEKEQEGGEKERQEEEKRKIVQKA